MSTVIISREVPSIDHELNDIHPVLQRIYLTRGITTKKQLEKELKNLLPFELLSNINTAVEIIYQHIKNNNKILIVGDFDGDGATSTALAVDFFRKLSINVEYLVPDRFKYGYGLSVELVDEAIKLQPNLLITVDTGISCLPGVKHAKTNNIDVVITDHHVPGVILPEADAIVNPNLKGDLFFSKNLAGVGVIFYVLLALRSFLREKNWFNDNNKPDINMAQFLDLVALGTITDLVPLDYNNQVLVHNGLNRIRSGQCRLGIKALLKISKRNHSNIVASDLGFSIGPRLNAAGRLDDMSLGIECLLSADPIHAINMAEHLDTLNNERKIIEQEMKQEALEIVAKLDFDNDSLPLAFCLYQENWHQGVIGIVAARIKEMYHRPVIVFAEDNAEFIKGSGRSIDGVHLRDVLQNIATIEPDILNKFGGHAMAAGLRLRKADFNKFSELFNHEISKILNHDKIHGRYYTDGNLDNADFNLELAALLKNSGPWGQKFPEPCFYGEFTVHEQRALNNLHMALKLTPNNQFHGGNIDAIMFNCNNLDWFSTKLYKIKIVYKLDVNEFNNQSKLQLLVDYLEPL